MLFSSITFLYYFLPCVLAAYFIAPKRWRNAVLLGFSLFFYGWGEPRYLIFMIAAILQGYLFGRLMERYRDHARAFLAASLIFSLGLLGVCKYADFFLENLGRLTGRSLPLLKIALPIGISFYTFQILSYVIDVYRGEVPAQKSLIALGAYISMFPQLIAGPIVRYSDIRKELKDRRHTLEGAASGAVRFVCGLSKKVLFANTLGELSKLCRASGEQSVLLVWLYAVSFTLQIYFDFSGYSDMAIGLGRVFGFRFMKISGIPISPPASPISGDGGISPSAPGSGIICTFPWGETGCQRADGSLIFWRCGPPPLLARGRLEFHPVGAVLRAAFNH